MDVLDTNVVSELRKAPSGRADPNVVGWAAAIDADAMYLSVISVMELELGVLMSERRERPGANALRRWLDVAVIPAFAGRLLAVDSAVARACAALHVPDPRSERDALIAATALVHGMAVATRNVRDFSGLGVTVVDPWA